MASKTYVIEKRGSQWCLLTADRARVLGCHDTREAAEAQERAVQSGKTSGDLTLARDTMAVLCPPCAATMATQGLTAIKVPYVDWTHAGLVRRTYRLDAPHLYQFHAGLCERFGDMAGFHARCAEAMAGEVEDAAAFCAALKDFCHPGARGQAALDPAKPHADAPRFTLDGVEIFRAGTWNGDAYTTADLDAMVAAFEAVGFTPPVHLGHAPDEGAPAVGWLTHLRRVGEVLVADVVDLAQAVYEVIRARGYDTLSAEIFWDLERNGVTYPRVLRSVALLGAHVPAVDLAPLSARLSTLPVAPSRRYTVVQKEGQMDPTIHKALDDLKTQVATLAAENGQLKAQVTLLSGGTDAGHLARLATDNVNLKARAETTAAALVREQAARREADARAKAEAVLVPAFRPVIKALYDLAHGAPQTVKYAVDLSGPAVETPGPAVVDALVSLLNGPAARLFVTLSETGGGSPRADDAGEELVRKAKAYAAANKVDYALAWRAMLDDPANAHLKAAYAASGR